MPNTIVAQSNAGNVGTIKTTEGHIMLARIVTLQIRLRNSERGATAVEYGLMVALIAVVVIVAVSLLGTRLSTLFDNVDSSV